MARQPRFFVPGETLHVIQRDNNREPIFATEDDYESRNFRGVAPRLLPKEEMQQRRGLDWLPPPRTIESDQV